MDQATSLQLMTPSELSEFLNISLTGVYRLVERRELPIYRVGRLLRFNRHDIEKYLEAKCFPPVDLKHL